MYGKNLKNFYINEEQSIYLLSTYDAQKLKNWVNLCVQQLEKLGYQNISMIGHGAYGFAFSGYTTSGREYVFKFSRITLPQKVRERLEEEAMMLSYVDHPLIPSFVAFETIGKQGILMMERGKGINFEDYSLKRGRLSVKQLISVASQLADILDYLRSFRRGNSLAPIVHGDIKPSNIMYDEHSGKIALVDWGSSVFAQVDPYGHYVSNNIMDLMSSDLQHTNARLGDVWFIGDEQLSGELSSPRFDEQGAAGTLYALASGQSCRFGHQAIPPRSLGLPKEMALVLENLLGPERSLRDEAGDYYLRNVRYLKYIVLADPHEEPLKSLVPVWSAPSEKQIDTVVYTSRTSFLKESMGDTIQDVPDDAQMGHYYKNYLQHMGELEKAFLSAVSRLAKYPVVGGLAVRWEKDGVYIDSSITLYDESLRRAFTQSINNMVNLAQSIHRVGTFKSCLFNARDTIHCERTRITDPFAVDPDVAIPYEVSPVVTMDSDSRQHSYFEDGKDPDEKLFLSDEIMEEIAALNLIHHTGCIIIEVLPLHLKLHSYYRLLDPAREIEFRQRLDNILTKIPMIKGLGVSGFMKLPYKDTRVFSHIDAQPDKFHPVKPQRQRRATSPA